MTRFYTSDWHLDENRIFDFNPFFRPFKSIQEQNDCIINNCNQVVGANDTLYHIGDVSITREGVKLLDKIKCKKRILIVGNYDEDKVELLSNYFDDVLWNTKIQIGNNEYAVNHYPAKANPVMMNIVGHIHGLWKVQPNQINVGVDAWNYKPLDDKMIQFVTTAIDKHYDINVFPDRFNVKIN